MARKRKRQVRRVSKPVKDTFGLPTARKFKVPKNRKGTGKPTMANAGVSYGDGGNSYVAVLCQADLLAPSEIRYYGKRVSDIARRWLKKSGRHSVGIELVTLFAKYDISDDEGGDDIVIGPRYFNPQDDGIPNVGKEWDYRRMFRSGPHWDAVAAGVAARRMLTDAGTTHGMQENELDFLGVFILAIRVRKWTTG